MLQPDPAERVGHGLQEFVMVVMLAAEHLHRLLDRVAIGLDIFGLGGVEVGLGVGPHVQVDARGQRPFLVIAPGDRG